MLKEKLQKLQNRAARIMTGANYDQFQFSILLLDIHLWHIEIQWIYKLKILY